MGKNIVICSDGTGNTAIKGRGTNVFKLYEALDIHTSTKDEGKQVAFYDDGIGSQGNLLFKTFAGAFGYGLARNVESLYRKLVRTYEPGDRIYMFGFSRGAFTVRLLADLVGRYGILKKEDYPGIGTLNRKVHELYSENRSRDRAWCEPIYGWVGFALSWIFPLFTQPRENLEAKEPHADRRIAFLGVWDTVDAVGFPIVFLATIVDRCFFRFKFRNNILGDHVLKACHAVSIDDERYTFHPVLWDETEKDQRDGRIDQVWFPGVHSNVGGGYPKQGLSLVSLYWMMVKANAAKLQFIQRDLEFCRDRRDAFDALYDSRSGGAFYYRPRSRRIKTTGQVGSRLVPRIHVSAFERIYQGAGQYCPGNIPLEFEIAASDGSEDLTQARLMKKKLAKAAEVSKGRTLAESHSMWQWARKASHSAIIVFSLVTLGILLGWLSVALHHPILTWLIRAYNHQIPSVLALDWGWKPILILLGIHAGLLCIHVGLKVAYFAKRKAAWAPMRWILRFIAVIVYGSTGILLMAKACASFLPGFIALPWLGMDTLPWEMLLAKGAVIGTGVVIVAFGLYQFFKDRSLRYFEEFWNEVVRKTGNAV